MEQGEHDAGRHSSGGGWARRGFAAGCALGLAILGLGVASRWDGVLSTLLGAPRPATAAAPLAFPQPTSGERALSEARARLEKGDGVGARAALESVSPQEAVYPLAKQLREQADAVAQGKGR